MFLNSDDLRELTGYRKHSGQIRWLSENGYRFGVRSDGRPNVLRRQVFERQCKDAGEERPTPNLDALNEFG